MPPKPLAEDLARKKAEREKAEKTQRASAALESPSGFEQAVNAIKDPVGTAKQLGRVAKETFYDPSKRFARAVDPSSGASPVERAAGLAESALYAADVLTPVPEQALYREAMERMLDDEVARYAASGGGAKYRGVLGIHGSPTQGLREIKPFLGSNYEPDQSVAWFWDTQTSGYDPIDAFNKARQYATGDGEVYVARFPRGAVNEDFGKRLAEGGSFSSVRPNMSREPGRVVGSVKLSPDMFLPGDILRPEAFETVESQMRDAMVSAMTPLERRRMAGQASLGTMPTARQLAEQQRRRLEAMNAMFGP